MTIGNPLKFSELNDLKGKEQMEAISGITEYIRENTRRM